MRRIGGRLRSPAPGPGGAGVEIPPLRRLSPNRAPARGPGQRLVASLTGAVASQNATEASKGPLGPVGNRPRERKGKRGLDCEADGPGRCESRA